MRRGQMVRAFVFIAILSVFAAQITVGCGQGYVYGTVNQKLWTGGDNGGGDKLIVVNNDTFEVPVSFYEQVQVGDMVRFDGRNWTIVKRANSPAPPSSLPPSPVPPSPSS